MFRKQIRDQKIENRVNVTKNVPGLFSRPFVFEIKYQEKNLGKLVENTPRKLLAENNRS